MHSLPHNIIREMSAGY